VFVFAKQKKKKKKKRKKKKKEKRNRSSFSTVYTHNNGMHTPSEQPLAGGHLGQVPTDKGPIGLEKARKIGLAPKKPQSPGDQEENSARYSHEHTHGDNWQEKGC